MAKSDILNILAEFQPEVQHKFHAEIKGIFGSYVRGEQSRKSDLDILVDFGPEADFLEEKMDCPVDLVPIRSIRKELKDKILAEAVYL